VRITEASQRLGISPRMLRYRESLGLLPVVRVRSARRRQARPGMPAADHRGVDRRSAHPGAPVLDQAARHRQFSPADLEAVAFGLSIEQRYDISPAALAFGLRVLTDPAARAQVAELGRKIGRIRPLPAMAMDFEKERALRLLDNPTPGRPARGPGSGG
jgi:MerR family transcriptional regulator, copper efflux regulator